MKRWARTMASVATLAGLLVGLVAPASAACPCAARRAAAVRAGRQCSACCVATPGVKITRPACCKSRVASTPPAVNPVPVQIEKSEASASCAAILDGPALSPSLIAHDALSRRAGESPPSAATPHRLSTLLRL